MKERIHLLVADDNLDELFFIKRALQGAGYGQTLETVCDGLQLIERLAEPLGAGQAEVLPDVLILDLNMPRKTGFDVLEWLKGQKFDFPVIVHTSTDDPQEAKKAMELGADAFVVKEVSYHALIRKLTEILKESA